MSGQWTVILYMLLWSWLSACSVPCPLCALQKPQNLTFLFHRKSRCWVAVGTSVQVWVIVLWLKRWIQRVLHCQGCFSTNWCSNWSHSQVPFWFWDTHSDSLTWWDLKQLSVLLLDVCFRNCTWVFAFFLECEISPKLYITVLKSIGLQYSWSLIPLEMGAY